MSEFDFGPWLGSNTNGLGTVNALSQQVKKLKLVKASTEEVWRGSRPPTHIAMGRPHALLRSLLSVKSVSISQAFRSASGSAIIPPKIEGDPGIVVLPHIHAITLDLEKEQVEQMQSAGVTVMPNEIRQIPSYSRSKIPVNDEISWALNKLGIAQSSKYDGTGIAVAVLDTGIDLHHPEFIDRIAPEDQKGFVVGIKDVEDGDGHGTHVAGLIFADGRTHPARRRIGAARSAPHCWQSSR